MAQGTPKSSTSIKSQSSPSAKGVQPKNQSKQSLHAETASTQGLCSKRREKERRALHKKALIMGQKRLSERTMLKSFLNSTSDYNQTGFNLRSNIFQGGPLESRSLMKDSYTSDVIKKAIRDPKNWHGRKCDELGKWHRENVVNLNLLKTLEGKYKKKKDKP